MKVRLTLLLASCVACGVLSLHAQAPAGAPAGSSGMCNDGSFSSAPSKRGACAGHKGVKTWYAGSNTASAAAPASAPTVARAAAPAPQPPPARAASPAAQPPAPAPAPARASSPAPQPPAPAPTPRTPPSAPATGGGNGQVWLNTTDNVYHCEGDRYYGKTKAGAYLSEADAKAKGGRAAYNKPCTR